MNGTSRRDTIPVISELPIELAKLFAAPRDILRIATDAGLDPGMLALHNLPALIAWTYVLMQAQHHPGIPAVVHAAQRDFPDNEVLARALQGRPTEQFLFSRPDPKVQVKIIPPNLSITVGTTVFRYIPPSTAWIGSDEGYEHERPRHRVKQSAFFLQDAPVTNAEFDAFCNTTGYRTSAELGSVALYVRDGAWRPLKGATWRLPSDGISLHPPGEDHPIVQVSWYDASIYCRWFAGATGLAFGLPTETQWEYAAGGPAGLRWPFGDTFKPGTANLDHQGTIPVRQFPSNVFGLYDMAGNVAEWCADWYVASWTRAGHGLSGEPSMDPPGPGAGSFKILRGGSWFDTPYHCRTANRFYADPILAAANWGFRPCLRLTGDLVQTLISEPGWDLRAEDMLEGN